MLDYLSGSSTISFDKTYQLLQKTTPLGKPWQAGFVFGDEIKTVTKKNLNTQLALKQQVYSTGETIASRLDNAAIKICATQSEYTNFGTHRGETFYTVPEDNELHLYLGDERVMISGGGGGDSFTVDYASVLSAEQSTTYTTGQTIAIAAQCGMTAIYGGSPSRGVCNGYRVLFNVPFADIVQSDVSSYLVLPIPSSDNTANAGQYVVARIRLTEQSVSEFSLRVFYTRYDAGGTELSSSTQTLKYAYSGSLSGLTFGIVADYATITEASAAFQAVGVYGKYTGKGHGLSNSNYGSIIPVAWLDGTKLTPSSVGSGGYHTPCYIKSLAEYHFVVSLNKRYEPSGGV